MQQVTRARRHRPLFLVDIAVPRDVEAAVAEIDGLYLYDIDDLEKVLADNLRGRAREAHKGEKIVDDEVRQFAAWLRTQAVVPTLRQLREHFVGVAQAEAARTCAHLPQAGERERRAIEATAEAIVNKLLHRPLTALKRDSAAQDGGELVGAVRRLFELAPAAETRLDAAEVEQAAAAALGTDAEGSSGGGRGELATAQSTEKR
jgi:glutamyl-tRNA reductase